MRDEEEIFSAQQRGALSTASAEATLTLLRDGIDLRTTTREELQHIASLTEEDIASILNSRELTPAQQVALRPYLRDYDVTGRVRLMTRVTTGDLLAPPVLLEARAQGPYHLSAGALLTTSRREVAPPRVNAGTLETSGFGYRLQWPRLYIQWQGQHARIIAGTFTVGFAERLTLDTTRRLEPNGFALSDDFRAPVDLSRMCRLASSDGRGACAEGPHRYVTPDFDTREVFRGVAASLERVSLGEERHLAAYGFVSFQTRSAYQYELLDRRTCTDLGGGCAAPIVSLEHEPTTRVVFSTLPAVFDELTGGGHVQVELSQHVQVGATGYAAAPFFHDFGPLDLTFQPWSRHPASGLFGAAGLNGQARIENVGFFVEATRTFDGSAQGGGFGTIGRVSWRQFELSLRYYDATFANPNSRPVSAPDEYDGQRASNELGARLALHRQLSPAWAVFGRADFWVLPFSNPRVGPAGMANLFALARVDLTASPHVRPTAWVETRNRNLASSRHGRCASGTVVFTEGQPFDCSGDLYRAALSLRVRPSPTFSGIVQSLITLSDDQRYLDRFRVDLQLWLEATGQFAQWLQWRVRTRYLNQDFFDNASLEHSWWSFIELTWRPREGAQLAARYDAYVWLDTRAVTLTRAPNPEHRITLDVRATF